MGRVGSGRVGRSSRSAVNRSVGRVGRVGQRSVGRVGRVESIGSGRAGSGRSVGRSAVSRSVCRVGPGRIIRSVGRVGSGRVGSGRVGSGRVGSGRSVGWSVSG